MNSDESEISLVAVVRDKFGRICLDEAVFFDNDRLQKIQEAVTNGRNSRDSAQERDC